MIGTLTLALSLLHLATPLVNLQLERRAQAPVTGDVALAVQTLFPARSVALISADPGERCGALCLGALLTGQADTVIPVAASPTFSEGSAFPLAQPATAFSLKEPGECAADDRLSLRGPFSPDAFAEDASGIDPKDIAGLMRAAGAQCITVRPATIEEADLAIAWGDLALRRVDGRGWLLDTRRAERIAVWRRDGADWPVLALETRVDYSHLRSLLPLPNLFPIFGGPKFYLPRQWATAGLMAGQPADTHLERRLTEAAGYVNDLRPAVFAAVDGLLDQIEVGEMPEDPAGLLADALQLSRLAGQDGDQTLGRVARLLEGTRLPDDEAARLISIIGDDEPDLALARFDALFARVAAFAPDESQRLPAFRYDGLSNLDWELSDAPPQALLRHAATITAVAADRDARDHFDSTILAFASTGEAAVSVFLALLDDVAPIRRDTSWPEYQGMSAEKTMRLGLRGLCRTTLAGVSPQRAIDEISGRIASGALPGAADDWRPVLAALFTLGATEAEVTAMVAGQDGAPDATALAEVAQDAARFPTCGD